MGSANEKVISRGLRDAVTTLRDTEIESDFAKWVG